MTKEAISKAPVGRVTRVPVGQRNILTVKGKDPEYEYRIVNDVDDRITQFLDAGYVIEGQDAVEVGDKRVATGTSVGSVKQLSVGQGVKAYVMKIRKEFYNEDQQAKLDHVAAQESATKEKALKGTYGDLEFTRK